MNIESQVIEAFNKVVKGKQVTLESNIKELGLDSLDVVDMLMDMEEEFNIEFANDEMVNLNTVQDIVNAIENKIK
jgi:acyl carrier protein